MARGTRYVNSAAGVVTEYFHRQKLRDLGYQFNGDNLDIVQADIFGVISLELEAIRAEEMRKTKARMSAKRKRR
jgi:hypothetical protein